MQKHAVQRSPRLPSVVIFSIHFPAITRGCIPASIRRTPTDKERTEYTRRHQLAKWLNIFDLPMFGAETLWRVARGAGRDDAVAGKMMHSRPTLPVPSVDLSSLPASRRGAEGFVCVSASLATVPLGCAGPPDAIADRQRCATGLHTPQWLLSPPSLPPSFATRRAKKPPLHPKCRLLTYLAVSSLIQKTSKQMRSSPVQRCRPAAHASCQETPHTCWLCTFPGKQKQTLDGGGEKKRRRQKDETFNHAWYFFIKLVLKWLRLTDCSSPEANGSRINLCTRARWFDGRHNVVRRHSSRRGADGATSSFRHTTQSLKFLTMQLAFQSNNGSFD